MSHYLMFKKNKTKKQPTKSLTKTYCIFCFLIMLTNMSSSSSTLHHLNASLFPPSPFISTKTDSVPHSDNEISCFRLRPSPESLFFAGTPTCCWNRVSLVCVALFHVWACSLEDRGGKREGLVSSQSERSAGRALYNLRALLRRFSSSLVSGPSRSH